jgi:hypothetical protein
MFSDRSDLEPQVIKLTSSLLANGRRFSPGTPAFSTNKFGHHDIAKILLKVALSTINQSINRVIFVIGLYMYELLGNPTA